MIINVLINYFVGYSTTVRAKVASTPKVLPPIFCLQFRKLYLHLPGATPFCLFGELANGYMGWNAAKNMYMIARNYSVKYFDIHFISYLSDQIAYPLLQCSPKYFVPIFCNPNQVIAVIIRRMASFAVFRYLCKATTLIHYAKPEGALV